ncbi:MAG: O-antigen ligase family protein [Planctomycetota bacterium]
MYLFQSKGLSDNPILFGRTFATLLIIIFVSMFEHRRFTLINFVLIGLSMYLMLLSGSRGVIVSVAVAIALYLSVFGKMSLKTKFIAVFFLLLLFFACYMFIPKKLKSFYQYSVSVAATQDATSSIQMRITKWERAICDFTESPLIGVGTGNSNNRSGRPHNILLELAAEFGILGLLIFIPLCSIVVVKAVVFLKNERLSNSHVLMKLLLVLFIYFLVHAMFSGYIANQTCLYMTIGLICSLMNLKNDFIGYKKFNLCCVAAI